MEMVAHNRISEQLHPAERGQLMQLLPQHFLRHVVEEEFPVHRPRHAMVNRRPLGCLKTFRSWHAVQRETKMPFVKLILTWHRFVAQDF